MSAIAMSNGETVTKLVAGATREFAHVSNAELLEGTRRLVGRSNQVLAALLAHLGEVEARGVFRICACTSLYTYLIYELRFSEDEAARRVAAAKLVRRFPALLEAVANGELHLTGLLMLGPLLTDENLAEVLGRSKFRTKKEIGTLVRTLAPLPRVPDRVEPLGPELPRSPRRHTWEEFVTSLCPPVRELRPGKRPADWANDTAATVELSGPADSRAVDADGRSLGVEAGAAPPRDGGTTPAPARLAPQTAPQTYQVQFTTDEEHVQLIEKAKGLLPRGSENGLAELHRQAMRLLVAKLEKKRFGAPRQRGSSPETPRQRGSKPERSIKPPRQRGSEPVGSTKPPRQRGSRSRYIPAATRRALYERDEGRCTYVDEHGERCRETSHLEIHHLDPFAWGCPHELEKLALRCTPHNTLAAEQDFGSDHIAAARDGCRHESHRRSARK